MRYEGGNQRPMHEFELHVEEARLPKAYYHGRELPMP
jgi:hypothetical protein